MRRLTDTLKLRNLTLRNRVVMPPMVIFKADDTGAVTDRHIAHYRRRAAGGCGLVIVEATAVVRDGRLSAKELGLWEDRQVEGLARIAAACHGEGASIFIQLVHAGMKAPVSVTDDPVCPSEYHGDPRSARAMSTEEIAGVREAYFAAASRAAAAGFDGVELHGAHGYLLDQFASPVTNRRTDTYGGQVEGRLRLIADIIRRLREEAATRGLVIGARIGCNEPDLSDGVAVARYLERCGVDLLHVSAGLGGTSIPEVPAHFAFNWIAYGGVLVAKNVRCPVIAVNGIRTGKQAEQVLRAGPDLIAIGHGHLVDPDWSKKVFDGAQPVTCLDCKPGCHWFTNADECPRHDPSWDELDGDSGTSVAVGQSPEQ